jgi:hypothetical protein
MPAGKVGWSFSAGDFFSAEMSRGDEAQIKTALDGEDANGSPETAGIVSTASLVRLKFVAIKISEPVFDLKQKVFL